MFWQKGQGDCAPYFGRKDMEIVRHILAKGQEDGVPYFGKRTGRLYAIFWQEDKKAVRHTLAD